MGNKPKVCIFCGATPLSREHIWSEWTYKILPKLKGGAHERGLVVTAKHNPKIKEPRYLKNYQGQVNTIQIRAVCASKRGSTNSLGKIGCNDGWMSSLDAAAKPVLTKLILGEPVVLGREQLGTLAAWITLKVMVCEHEANRKEGDPDTVVTTQDERSAFMRDPSPPNGWKIWIANQDAGQWRTGFARHSAFLTTLDEGGVPVVPVGPLAHNSQTVTFGFGRLLFHVFSSRHPGALAEFDFPNKVSLFRIHPFDGGFFWPPDRVLGDAEINTIVRQFDLYTSKIPWRAPS
jgi:hypothetical protein